MTTGRINQVVHTRRVRRAALKEEGPPSRPPPPPLHDDNPTTPAPNCYTATLHCPQHNHHHYHAHAALSLSPCKHLGPGGSWPA
uniref:Uncharacterized protein n=1 Tax=Mesocestoides corti TaxID=53468 RepID=A0A5K3FKC1_MESCO